MYSNSATSIFSFTYSTRTSHHLVLDKPTNRKMKVGPPPDSTAIDFDALFPPPPPPPRRQSASGVFGAGVGKEGNFSRYEGRDIELDPTAPVTAVLTVAYIPPEEGVDGRPGKPRVQSFIVDDSPQNRQRHSSKSALEDIDAVLMECAPPAPAVSALGCAAAAAAAVVARKFSPKAAPSLRSGGGTSADAGDSGSGSGGGSGGGSGDGGGGSMKECAKSESIGTIGVGRWPQLRRSGGDDLRQRGCRQLRHPAQLGDGPYRGGFDASRGRVRIFASPKA